MRIERQNHIDTLDLGIGRGGKYLNKSGPTHVGIDTHFPSLQWVRERYGVKSVLADAFNLPVINEAFQNINIFYPHDTALYGLAYADTGLWEELNRVLKIQGMVHVIFDVYPTGHREVGLGVIPDLLNTIRDSAEQASFAVYTQAVDADYVQLLGTRYARMAAERAIERSEYKNYSLIAMKF